MINRWNLTILGIVYSSIVRTADRLCLIRTSSYPRNKPSWLSKELIELSKDKDRALKIVRRSCKQEDKDCAKRLRNRCNICFRLARRKYITDSLNDIADNPRKCWQFICELLPKNQSAKLIKLCNDKTGDYLPSDQVSTYINTFFAEIGPTVARAIT